MISTRAIRQPPQLVSENFGQVDLPLGVFQRVLFNLYDDFDSHEFEEFLF